MTREQTPAMTRQNSPHSRGFELRLDAIRWLSVVSRTTLANEVPVRCAERARRCGGVVEEMGGVRLGSSGLLLNSLDVVAAAVVLFLLFLPADKRARLSMNRARAGQSLAFAEWLVLDS